MKSTLILPIFNNNSIGNDYDVNMILHSALSTHLLIFTLIMFKLFSLKLNIK